MRRLATFRHGISLVIGAAVMWLAEAVTPSILVAILGSTRTAEFLAAWAPPSTTAAAIWAIALALVLSLTQEALGRLQGLVGAILLGILAGFIALTTRFFAVPSHLYSAAVIASTVRCAAVVGASVLIFYSKRGAMGSNASPHASAAA